MDIKHRVLLIVGILMFAKAIWSLVFPEAARKVAAWWIKTVKHVNTFAAIVYVLLGVAFFVLVLFEQPLVNWLLGVSGLLCIYAGIISVRFADMERLMQRLILRRKAFMIRCIGAVLMVVAAVFIWVALTP